VSFRVLHLNPAGLRRNPAFTNVVVVSGAAKRIVIGAIDPVDEHGALVGRGDLAAQTEQIFRNLEVSLAAAGARLEDVIIWRIFVAEGQALDPAVAVFARVWGQRANPPANTVVFVPALGYPGALLCLEAEAVVADAPGS
jgi:enamine deaminase RidA (YjgF/YER057c/UK114 family)